MKIGIAGDHHGVKAKEKLIQSLEKKGYTVINYGTDTVDSVDYPLYAFKVGEGISNGDIDYGILLCGSGIGMSIACNKVNGVRCARVTNKKDAMLSRLHNNANVIALSSLLPTLKMKQIVYEFLKTDFSKEERHHKRVKQINTYGVKNDD